LRIDGAPAAVHGANASARCSAGASFSRQPDTPARHLEPRVPGQAPRCPPKTCAAGGLLRRFPGSARQRKAPAGGTGRERRRVSCKDC
jgi:hypothetical protein